MLLLQRSPSLFKAKNKKKYVHLMVCGCTVDIIYDYIFEKRDMIKVKILNVCFYLFNTLEKEYV